MVVIKDKVMEMSDEAVQNFVFSPSSLVDFETPKLCAAKWFFQWVEKSLRRPPSYAQLLGQYFEYLCLGESPYCKIPELPLKKDGSKPIVVQRVEKQAEVFKQLFTPGHKRFLNERIIFKHIKLTSDEHPKKRGIIDFITEDLNTGRIKIRDLKLTMNIDSNYGITPWNTPENIDPVQLGTYKAIYIEKMQRVPLTEYLVFECGPRMKVENIALDINDRVLISLDERYTAAYSRFSEYMMNYDFLNYRPHDDNCKTCFVEKCEFRDRYEEWKQNEIFTD